MTWPYAAVSIAVLLSACWLFWLSDRRSEREHSRGVLREYTSDLAALRGQVAQVHAQVSALPPADALDAVRRKTEEFEARLGRFEMSNAFRTGTK